MSVDISKLYEVFTNPNHKVNPDNIEWFISRVREVVVKSFSESGKAKPPRLRASNIGKKDRELWFEFNQKRLGIQGTQLQVEHGNEVDDMAAYAIDGATYAKFLNGDIWEAILVLLLKEAGYKVDVSQNELAINQVTGHPDCVITHPNNTREVIDTKSASRFAFGPKFVQGDLLEGNDGFGYIGQNSHYRQATNADGSGWLAVNKDTGEMAYLRLPVDQEIDVFSRVEHLKKILKEPQPPEALCYPTKQDKDGNTKIAKECGWCPFKKQCFKDKLRTFRNAGKWEHYTEIVKQPKGEEWSNGQEKEDWDA